MGVIEVACALILGFYLAVQERRREFLTEAALLLAGALIGEDTCIRLYGFYHYAPGWHAWADQVPLMIVLIWPAVVLSARTLARALLGERAAGDARKLALTTGLLVTFDAALMEPIATRAGLWSWTEPGLFRVPVIGVLGWGFFATAAVYAMATLPRAYRAAVVLIAPVATHAMLVGTWWGLLRWVLRAELPPIVPTLVAFAASGVFALAIARSGARVAPKEMAARALAAGFFAWLLARAGDASLAAYAAAFAPPYLLLSQRALTGQSAVARPAR